MKKFTLGLKFGAFLTLLCMGTLLTAQTTVSFSAGGGSLPFNDGAYDGSLGSMVSKTVNVTGIPTSNVTINEISIQTSLTSTWAGDLTIKLVDPAGNVVALMSRPGLTDVGDNGVDCCGSSSDFIAQNPTTFKDGGANGSSENIGGLGSPIPTAEVSPSAGSIAAPPALTTLSAMVTGLGTDVNGSYTLYVGDSFFGDPGTIEEVTVNVTYTSTDPCVFTCPSNVVVNLDPGACDAIVNYPAPEFTGNCGVDVLVPGTITQNVSVNTIQDALQCGVNPTSHWRMYDLPSMGITDGFLMESLNMASWSAGTVQIFVYEYTGAYPSTTLDVGQMTLLAQSNATAVVGNQTFSNQVLTSPASIPPGGRFVVEQRQLAGGPWCIASNYAGNTDPAYMNCTGSIFGFPAIPTSYVSLGYGNIHPIQELVGQVVAVGVPDIVQTSGLASGESFPRGTTTNCFDLVSPLTGEVLDQCCFDVTINEYPNPVSTLSCNDLINISLDATCSYTIGADDVLEGGPHGCYDDYIVQIDKTLPLGNGPWLPAVLGPSDINKTYAVRVTDPDTGNSCWGQVHVEDKIKPIVLCDDLALPCNAPSTAVGNTSLFTLVNDGTGAFPINDNQTTTGTITVAGIPADAKVLDLNVTIDINHTWIGDIDLVLTAPNGTDIVLWDNTCGATDNIKVTFDDEDPDCYNPCVNYTTGDTIMPVSCLFAQFGVFAGNDFMSKALGVNALGDWTVTASDNTGGDQGTVNDIQLAITYFSATAVYQPEVIENCGTYTLTSQDTQVPGGCDDGFTNQILRKWTATDASGNTGTCVQTISFIIPNLGNLVTPPDYDDIDAPAYECGGAYPTPDWIEGQGDQGYPYVFGEPDGCTISWTYEDVVIEICDGTYKILRKWDVIDWCAGEAIEHNQIIKVLDSTGPDVECPANITVSTDPFTCCATVNLPDVIVSDACSRINNVSWMVVGIDQYTFDTIGMFTGGGSLVDFPGNNHWNPDTLAQFGYTPCLPIGTHSVYYTVEDDCGNLTTCNFNLTVRDYTPPVAACDEHTIVSIGIDDPFDCYEPSDDGCEFAGVTWVKATTFDDGSYDNCGNVKFTIRRMAPYSDCILGLNPINGHPDCDDFFPDFPSEFERAISEYDSIKFYCCEVGTEQMVILRVYQTDVNGNITIGPDGTPVYNECMIEVEVQDKLKPVCQSPANVTVSCENFDPSLWAYGKASVYDNCCLDSTQVYQGQKGLSHAVNYALFDTLCNKGTITRTFRAWDCHGFSSQCTQRIVVNYEQDYYVKFPNDVIVNECDGSGNYGEPTFFGEDCELLGVSFEDEVFTVVPDACYKIERTWHIINWCTYNPNQPCIFVPNPNPNAISNHPSNLPGPTVSAPGTLQPWNPTIVKINPTDALPTNYSTFWDANANCYEYKQIIKIVDNEDPVFDNCPASPVEICDLTANDPLFWNDAAYWDNTIGTHDLCEAPTELCVTVTDSCGGADINVRYLLFLDIDGDGVMETEISSTNPPAPNSVPYLGGTPFDHRPVVFNQKYRFNIDWTTSGTARTACVRWDWLQQPANHNDNILQGVVPQLPYGTHKIKWFAEDGCGNEAICEYTFVVKDCKKPTVVCINGLSVNIMPTGMITLWASDFLQYTEDNCTPADQIKIAIVKSSQSTGTFPVDALGNPITSVTFDCSELGPQPVQLWAQDAAGNADFCETYVIVQDNMGNCDPDDQVSVAGALKTEVANGVEEGNVELNSSNPAFPPAGMFDMTDNNGDYMFSNALPISSDATVTPLKDDNHLNGVSTYDLVLISKHILGLETLDSPYKMIAADANKSNSITTFDIVELRKLILGIYNELPNNTSWRFVDQSFDFADPSNPFASQFPEFLTIAAIQNPMDNGDFVSVKVGDVNGSAIANSFMSADDRTAGTLLFDVANREVKAGEEFTVNFTAAEAVLGYQFTMNFNNLAVVDVVPGSDMSMDNFAVFADAITTSFDGKVAGEFGVKFRAQADGMLSDMVGVSSRITKAEAYNTGAERLDVAFRFDGTTIAGVGFELYQNTPNPFVNKTMIGFHLPEATEATLSIYDETGRMIYTQTGDFAKGYNAITIDRGMLNTTGMLYYKVETAKESATRKMIQTK